MTLKLITGRAGSGKTEAVGAGIVDAARSGSCALLVPTHPDVVRARRDLAARGVARVRVATIDDHVSQLWGLRGDGRQLVGAPQRRALLSEAAASTDFARIARSATRPGFVAALEPVMSRLGDYDREDLTAESALDADILRLLDRYTSLVHASDLVERGEAARLLSSAEPLDAAVFVDGSPICRPVREVSSRRGRGCRVSMSSSRCPGLEGSRPRLRSTCSSTSSRRWRTSTSSFPCPGAPENSRVSRRFSSRRLGRNRERDTSFSVRQQVPRPRRHSSPRGLQPLSPAGERTGQSRPVRSRSCSGTLPNG